MGQIRELAFGTPIWDGIIARHLFIYIFVAFVPMRPFHFAQEHSNSADALDDQQNSTRVQVWPFAPFRCTHSPLLFCKAVGSSASEGYSSASGDNSDMVQLSVPVRIPKTYVPVFIRRRHATFHHSSINNRNLLSLFVSRSASRI